MNFSRITVALVLVSIVSIAAAQDIGKQLAANYAAITAAFKQGDINPISNFMAPGFVVHLDNGTSMGRDQVLKDYKAQMGIIKNISWSRKIASISRVGNTVVATVDGDVKGLLLGPDKKKHTMHMLASAKDSWQKNRGKWVLIQSVVTKRTVEIDGHPVQIPPKH